MMEEDIISCTLRTDGMVKLPQMIKMIMGLKIGTRLYFIRTIRNDTCILTTMEPRTPTTVGPRLCPFCHRLADNDTDFLEFQYGHICPDCLKQLRITPVSEPHRSINPLIVRRAASKIITRYRTLYYKDRAAYRQYSEQVTQMRDEVLRGNRTIVEFVHGLDPGNGGSPIQVVDNETYSHMCSRFRNRFNEYIDNILKKKGEILFRDSLQFQCRLTLEEEIPLERFEEISERLGERISQRIRPFSPAERQAAENIVSAAVSRTNQQFEDGSLPRRYWNLMLLFLRLCRREIEYGSLSPQEAEGFIQTAEAELTERITEI